MNRKYYRCTIYPFLRMGKNMCGKMQDGEYLRIIRNHLRSAYLLSDARIEEVMPGFVATLDTLMQDLEKFSVSGNFRELNRTGHAIKGALLNLGLQELAQQALSIEKFDPLQAGTVDPVLLVADLKKKIDKIAASGK